MMAHPNILNLEIVADALKELTIQVCFVGGATTALYLSDADIEGLRPTEDIDCVIELGSYLDYHRLGEKLTMLGFRHPTEKGPLCRWNLSGIKVDIMPTDSQTLGFTNLWYEEGMRSSILKKLPSGREIRIFPLPLFLASKLEAFKGRGNNDYYGSKDIEDIVVLLDGTRNLREEVLSSLMELQEYLRTEFETLSNEDRFIQALEGHLQSRKDVQGRSRRVLDILRNL